MTAIGVHAFSQRTDFTSLTLPANLITIDDYAFNSCINLTGTLTIPNSVTTIGDNAFLYCGQLSNLALSTSLTTIGNGAFKKCEGLTCHLTIPNSVLTIGASAFYECKHISGLTLSTSLTTIGDSAFSYCTGLTGDLTIPNSVLTIGNEAFNLCENFNGTLALSTSLTTIGNDAFFYCLSFTGYLTIPNSVTTIGDGAFSHCYGFNGNLTIPNSVTTIGNGAFYRCLNLSGTLTIPNSVETIGSEAFHLCRSLTGNLIIPDSVETIGNDTFAQCKGFTGTLTIPESVTSIGASAFYECNNITGTLAIPDSVTTVGNDAFFNCRSFTGTLTIPGSVTSIGNNAFHGCKGVKEIVFQGTALPTTIGTEAFRLNEASPEKIYPAKAPPTLQDGFLDDYGGTYTVFDYGHTVTVLIDDDAAGTVSGGGKYYYNETVTMDVTLSSGYEFTDWNDGNTDRPRTYTMALADVTFTANTAATVYGITYYLYDGTNDPSNPDTYVVTDLPITFAAPTKDGYAFKGWFEDADFSIGTEGVPLGSIDTYVAYAKFIERKEITVDDIPEQTYAGYGIEPAVTVRSNGAPIAQEGNYTVSYANNVNSGTGEATVKGTGDYIGTVVKYFTINPKELTVTADNKSVTFPNAAPSFTASYGDFADGEDENDLGGALAFACDYDGTEYRATFPITPSGHDSTNYNITYVAGTLTVNRGTAAEPSAYTGLVYNGTELTGVPEGVGYTLANHKKTDADDYQATASVVNGYEWSPGDIVEKTIPWSIAKRGLTVTTESATGTYNGAALTAGGSVTGFVTGETASFAVTGSQINAGYSENTYTLTFNGTASETNYRVTDNLGILAVLEKTLTVTTYSTTKVYDGAALTAGGSVTGFVDGEGHTFTVDGSQTNVGSSVNGYTLTYDEGTNASNYSVTEELGTLTVTEKALTVTAHDKSVTFPNAAPAFTASCEGFADGEGIDDLGGKLAFNCGYNGTEYRATFAIKPSGYASGNYDITYVDGTLTVNKGTATAPSAA
ncbi:MAG: leucine-rich repeat protein, partial [Thermoplasmatales archaeon]|nr:leucine-rich repeat protein [Thermoplasmatales archaeon]